MPNPSEIFEKEGILAVPLLVPVMGFAGNCSFRIRALPEEYVFEEMFPAERSSVLVAFAVWHSVVDYLSKADGIDEDGEMDEAFDRALKESVNDLDQLHPYLVNAECLIRRAWPYEAWLCDQIMEGGDQRGFLACFGLLGEFPNLLPSDAFGLCGVVVNVPTLVGRIQVDPRSEAIIPIETIMTLMARSPTAPPPLALIPGGAGNSLFYHEYVDFGEEEVED